VIFSFGAGLHVMEWSEPDIQNLPGRIYKDFFKQKIKKSRFLSPDFG
jgi:hypothetical protein